MPVHNRTPARRLSPIEPIAAAHLARGWWIPDLIYGALRVVAALVLLRHGVQEHYGLLLPAGETWAGAPTLYSEAWFAASIELIGGALLGLGLFTRPVAFVLGVAIAAAYFVAPLIGWAPRHWQLGNDEISALYALVMLSFAAIGPGLFSVDAMSASMRTRSSWSEVPLSPWVKRQYRRRELTR